MSWRKFVDWHYLKRSQVDVTSGEIQCTLLVAPKIIFFSLPSHPPSTTILCSLDALGSPLLTRVKISDCHFLFSWREKVPLWSCSFKLQSHVSLALILFHVHIKHSDGKWGMLLSGLSQVLSHELRLNWVPPKLHRWEWRRGSFIKRKFDYKEYLLLPEREGIRY